jgi:hypothetical protein
VLWLSEDETLPITLVHSLPADAQTANRQMEKFPYSVYNQPFLAVITILPLGLASNPNS